MSELLENLKQRSKLRRQMIARLVNYLIARLYPNGFRFFLPSPLLPRLLQWGFSNVQQLRQALNFPTRKQAHNCSANKGQTRIGSNSSRPNDADEDLHKHSSPFSVHNDFSQHFVDTGQRPQNFIREGMPSNRFQEHPKQNELVPVEVQLTTNTYFILFTIDSVFTVSATVRPLCFDGEVSL